MEAAEKLQDLSRSCAVVMGPDDTLHKVKGALLHLWFVKQMQAGLIPFEQISLSLVQPSTVPTIACSNHVHDT